MPLIDRLKPWAEMIQAIVATAGIIVAGIWTYMIFIEDRESYPHANLDETITRVKLTDQVNLLEVILKIHNSGQTLMHLSQATVRLQQVLPINGCAADAACVVDDLNEALTDGNRVSDRFSWPVETNREAAWDTPLIVEPGEDDVMDFEFVIPATIQVVRVYGFVPNDALKSDSSSPGWSVARFYDTRKPAESAESTVNSQGKNSNVEVKK